MSVDAIAWRVLRHFLAELWSTEEMIVGWLRLWNRTTPPVEGRSLKSIFENFLRLLVKPLSNAALTERGLFPFGLEYAHLSMEYRAMTTKQRAAAYATIALSPFCFQTVGRGGNDQAFSERGFVIQRVKDVTQLPRFPTEEFTRLFCIMTLEWDDRLQPVLLSAFDTIWVGDKRCFHDHNEAFYAQLRQALDAYDPLESLREMIYMPWDARPIISGGPAETGQMGMRKETERERRRRIAREERMASEMAAYAEKRQRAQLDSFAIGMGLV